MTHDPIVHGAAVPTHLLERLVALTGAVDVEPRPPRAVRFKGAHPHPEIRTLCERERLDFAYLPAGRSLGDYRLLAMDMDSTLITIECIDEVADFAGCKPEVAAMRGEMDYAESLRRRVALLAGLPEDTLRRVHEERLRLSPGATELIAAAKKRGLATMVVSGGFSYFTQRLREQLGLDHAFSNQLEITGLDGLLTVLDA